MTHDQASALLMILACTNMLLAMIAITLMVRKLR